MLREVRAAPTVSPMAVAGEVIQAAARRSILSARGMVDAMLTWTICPDRAWLWTDFEATGSSAAYDRFRASKATPAWLHPKANPIMLPVFRYRCSRPWRFRPSLLAEGVGYTAWTAY
jgi:hypothetical protein